MAIESGLLKLFPPAITRSAPSPTIFSTSTVPSLTTCADLLRRGRVVVGVRHPADARPGADGEEDLGGGGRERDDPRRPRRDGDGRPLVVGQGERVGRREPGMGSARRAGGAGIGVAGTATRGPAEPSRPSARDRPTPGRAWRPRRSRRGWRRRAPGRRTKAGGPPAGSGENHGTSRTGCGSTRVRGQGRTAQGARQRDARVSRSGSCLPAPFSRGFVRLCRGAGDRTSAVRGTAVTVAGLCRNLTGFATTRRVVTRGG